MMLCLGSGLGAQTFVRDVANTEEVAEGRRRRLDES